MDRIEWGYLKHMKPYYIILPIGKTGGAGIYIGDIGILSSAGGQ